MSTFHLIPGQAEVTVRTGVKLCTHQCSSDLPWSFVVEGKFQLLDGKLVNGLLHSCTLPDQLAGRVTEADLLSLLQGTTITLP